MNRRFWFVALASLAACAALWWLFSHWDGGGFRWDEFRKVLAQVDAGWLATCLFVTLLSYVVRALRWKAMMAPVRPNASFRNLLSATCVGFTAVVFFGRPGELVRPWLIATRERVSLSSQLAVWFLERIFDLLAVVLLFGFALTGVDKYAAVSPRLTGILQAGGYLALIAGVACVMVLMGTALFSDRARQLCDWMAGYLPAKLAVRARKSLDSFLQGLETTGNLRALLRIAMWSAVEWFVIGAGMYALFQAFGPAMEQFDLTATLIYMGFVAFGSAITLPGIGGGLQVSSMLILTELFGLPLATASACTLLVWITSWLTIVPVGLLFAFSEGLQWKNLKQMSELDAEGGAPPAKPGEVAR